MTDDRAKTALELDGHYVLGGVLGTGSMGVIYSAIQSSLGRRVAIKLPHPELADEPFVIRRFAAEARASGRLDHRNIARVIDFGGHDGARFLVMQHVAGAPLERLVRDHGPMETRIAVDLCGQLLDGLAAAHSAGIIHADIKTGNILVETLDDGALRAVLIDFGLARFSDEPSTDDGLWLAGTPEYLAPEMIRGGAPTAASDIYAAGVVLYELLTGTTPFGGGTNEEILDRQLNDAVVPPSSRARDRDIPEALATLVMRALAKDPSERFSSAAQFAAALRATTAALVSPPRLALGSQVWGFSTTTATQNWEREPIPVVRSATPTVRSGTCLQQSHIAVRAAIASGDGDAIVSAYLELVRVLVDGRKLEAAAAELERGLTMLRPGVTMGAAPPAIWRLQLCLAAMYSGLGQHAQARRAAILGQDDAVRADSALGEARADQLLVRLTRTTAAHAA